MKRCGKSEGERRPSQPAALRRRPGTGGHLRAGADRAAGGPEDDPLDLVRLPQIAGLGSSETARFFAIDSLEEAKAYLEHPLLGPRLRECSQALLDVSGKTAREILGETDATKLRSSMTLFASAAVDDSLFQEVLDKYYDGERDEETERRL